MVRIDLSRPYPILNIGWMEKSIFVFPDGQVMQIIGYLMENVWKAQKTIGLRFNR